MGPQGLAFVREFADEAGIELLRGDVIAFWDRSYDCCSREQPWPLGIVMERASAGAGLEVVKNGLPDEGSVRLELREDGVSRGSRGGSDDPEIAIWTGPQVVSDRVDLGNIKR